MSHGNRLQTRGNKEAIFQSNSRFFSSTFGVNSATLIKLLNMELWFTKTLIFYSNIKSMSISEKKCTERRLTKVLKM